MPFALHFNVSIGHGSHRLACKATPLPSFSHRLRKPLPPPPPARAKSSHSYSGHLGFSLSLSLRIGPCEDTLGGLASWSVRYPPFELCACRRVCMCVCVNSVNGTNMLLHEWMCLHGVQGSRLRVDRANRKSDQPPLLWLFSYTQ